MPQFDPELITVMKKVLEDTMMRVPSEYSNPAAKAYFAEYILKAAAQGKTGYDALIVAAADQIEVFIFVQLGPRLDTDIAHLANARSTPDVLKKSVKQNLADARCPLSVAKSGLLRPAQLVSVAALPRTTTGRRRAATASGPAAVPWLAAMDAPAQASEPRSAAAEPPLSWAAGSARKPCCVRKAWRSGASFAPGSP